MMRTRLNNLIRGPGFRLATFSSIAGVVLMAGCLNDSLEGPTITIDDSAALASVTVWPRAVTLARGASQQLLVTAKSFDGTVLTGATTTFTLSSDTLVRIDSTGLLTGLKAAPLTTVMITMRTMYNGMSHYDTSVVRVTDTAEQISRMSMAPARDTERYGSIGMNITPRATVYRLNNTTVSSPLVWFNILTPGSGGTSFGIPIQGVSFSRRGSVWIRGSAVLYGTEVIDSVEYIVGDPKTFSISVFSALNADEIGSTTSGYLTENGTFSVSNYTSHPITITFSDPTAVDGGNMTIPNGLTVTRTVIKKGDLLWTMNTTPVFSGNIVVR